VGATLIAASVVVLVIGLGWLSRGGEPEEQLAMPVVDGVTQATDADGEAVEVPPSQPAVAVSFAADGQILRPDPVRARVVDESGAEIIVPLAPNTTVDTVSGEIVPLPPGTTTRPGTSPTTQPTTTPTDPPTSPTSPTTAPTTDPPTTPPTTQPTTTTTEPPTTTTETPPTSEPDPGGLGGVLDELLP
jgi:hypothetical protein